MGIHRTLQASTSRLAFFEKWNGAITAHGATTLTAAAGEYLTNNIHVSADIYLQVIRNSSDYISARAIKVDSTGAMTSEGTATTIRSTAALVPHQLFRTDATNKFVLYSSDGSGTSGGNLDVITVNTTTLACTIGTSISVAACGLWQPSPTVFIAFTVNTTNLRYRILTLSGTAMSETTALTDVSGPIVPQTGSYRGVVVGGFKSNKAVLFEYSNDASSYDVKAHVLSLSGTTVSGSGSIRLVGGNSTTLELSNGGYVADVIPNGQGTWAVETGGEDVFIWTSYIEDNSDGSRGLIAVKYDYSADTIAGHFPVAAIGDTTQEFFNEIFPLMEKAAGMPIQFMNDQGGGWFYIVASSGTGGDYPHVWLGRVLGSGLAMSMFVPLLLPSVNASTPTFAPTFNSDETQLCVVGRYDTSPNKGASWATAVVT